MRATKPPKNYPAELRDHAVRRVRKELDKKGSEWAASGAIVSEIGCGVETVIGQFKADIPHVLGSGKAEKTPRAPLLTGSTA